MYKIADLYVELNVDGRTKRNAEPYLCSTNSTPHIVIKKNFEEAKKRYSSDVIDFINASDDLCVVEDVNYSYENNQFAMQLLNFDGIAIHASAVVVDDKAYLFSAPSGTGKSTHTEQWLKLFGERAFILNDDVPAIRIVDNDFFAYGTPWAGSTNINRNAKAKLQGICFLTRSNKNWINRMNTEKAIFRLFDATSKKINKEMLEKKVSIINKIVTTIPIFEMGCTPDIDAARTAYNAMSDF